MTADTNPPTRNNMIRYLLTGIAVLLSFLLTYLQCSAPRDLMEQ